jgi:L-lactate dehydrogenase (cytochrome)
VVSTARALPRITEAVGDDVKILADGGIRSGLDVARMLSLGADFVLLGRAWAYALAAGGGAEVERMLRLVEAELRVAMALTGVTRIEEMDGRLIDR